MRFTSNVIQDFGLCQNGNHWKPALDNRQIVTASFIISVEVSSFGSPRYVCLLGFFSSYLFISPLAHSRSLSLRLFFFDGSNAFQSLNRYKWLCALLLWAQPCMHQFFFVCSTRFFLSLSFSRSLNRRRQRRRLFIYLSLPPVAFCHFFNFVNVILRKKRHFSRLFFSTVHSSLELKRVEKKSMLVFRCSIASRHTHSSNKYVGLFCNILQVFRIHISNGFMWCRWQTMSNTIITIGCHSVFVYLCSVSRCHLNILVGSWDQAQQRSGILCLARDSVKHVCLRKVFREENKTVQLLSILGFPIFRIENGALSPDEMS